MYDHPIDEDGIARIKEHGCCLGKYRVSLNKKYYCLMGGVLDCLHQLREHFVVRVWTNNIPDAKSITSYMTVCKTNNQRPCEECDVYSNATSGIRAEKNK